MKQGFRASFIAAFLLSATGSFTFGQEAIQTVDASLHGAPLPPSTGQVVDPALLGGITCQKLVADNLRHALKQGYRVESGAFFDPISGIRIRQGCVSAPELYEAAPSHPFAGKRPVQPQMARPQIGADTAILIVLGQSNAGNYAVGRKTANSNAIWSYAGRGQFYEASDPLHDPGDPDAIDASPWIYVAEQLLGKIAPNGQKITSVGIALRAVGGSMVAEWGPEGVLGNYLKTHLDDIRRTLLEPAGARPSVFIIWSQGEADTLPGVRAEDYAQSFHKVRSVINGFTKAPIFVSTTTICNYREATYYPPPDNVLIRPPHFYIEKELARIEVRKGQGMVINGDDVLAGPNTDSIPPLWRWDGCHFGARGLDMVSKMWADALIKALPEP